MKVVKSIISTDISQAIHILKKETKYDIVYIKTWKGSKNLEFLECVQTQATINLV